MKIILLGLLVGVLPQLSNALTCEPVSENLFFSGFSFQNDFTGKLVALTLKEDSSVNLQVTRQEFQKLTGVSTNKQFYIAEGSVPNTGDITFTLSLEGKEGNGINDPSLAPRIGEVTITAKTKPLSTNLIQVTCYEDYQSHMTKNIFVAGEEYLKTVHFYKKKSQEASAIYTFLQKITSVDSAIPQTEIHITKTNILDNIVSSNQLTLNKDWYFNIQNIQDFCLENPGTLEYLTLKNKRGLDEQVYSCKVVSQNTAAQMYEINWYVPHFPNGAVKTNKYKGIFGSTTADLKSSAEYTLK